MTDACRPSVVLLAEDDDELRCLFAADLRAAGIAVLEARNGAEVLDFLGVADGESPDFNAVDLVVSDFHMPGVTGMELLEGLSKIEPRKPFILITAFADPTTTRRALTHGALAVLSKPLKVADLRQQVEEALSALRSSHG